MSAPGGKDQLSQIFSNIHIAGNARTHVGNAYHQSDEFYATLDKLSTITPAARLQQIQEDRLDGSVDWFLSQQAYLQWRDQDSHTLRCDGVPGAGKTFVMATIIDDLGAQHASNEGIAIAAFFCDFQQRGQLTASEVLASIARQLVEQEPSLLHIVKKHMKLLHARRPRPGVTTPYSSATDQQKMLISELCAKLAKVYVVVDALDEFSAQLEQRNQLASSLAALRSLGEHCSTAQFKLCVSSRTELETRRYMEPFTLILIRPDAEPIRAFIVDILEQSPTLQRINRSDDLHQQIVTGVENRSDRIFKLAALQMQYLAVLTSTLRIRQALPTLSKRFEDYYAQSLARIRSKPLLQDRIFNMFAWLVFAKATLHAQELRQCLLLDEDLPPDSSLEDFDEHVERLVAESEGLIAIGSVSPPLPWKGRPLRRTLRAAPFLRPVSVAHETIEAYLLDQRSVWASVQHDPGSFIFTNCARFLALEACVHAVIRRTMDTIDSRNVEPRLVDSFLMWCLRYWDVHWTQVPLSHPCRARELPALLQTVADGLMRAGKVAGIDPLFACVLHNWHYLEPMLVSRGADAGAKYHGFTLQLAVFAQRSPPEGSVLWSIASADMFQGYHDLYDDP